MLKLCHSAFKIHPPQYPAISMSPSCSFHVSTAPKQGLARTSNIVMSAASASDGGRLNTAVHKARSCQRGNQPLSSPLAMLSIAQHTGLPLTRHKGRHGGKGTLAWSVDDSSSGGGGGGNNGKVRGFASEGDGGSRKSWPPLPKWAYLLGATVLVAGFTVAAAPVLLSSPLALQALLAAANSAVPVKIEAERLEVDGWLGGLGSVNLHGLRVTELEAVGGQELMWVPQLIMQGTLWRALLLQGTPSNPVHVVLKEPDLNGSYDASVRDFRMNRFLEQAGILAPPPPSSPTTPAAFVDTMESVAERTAAAAETAAGAATDAAVQAGAPTRESLSHIVGFQETSSNLDDQQQQQQQQHASTTQAGSWQPPAPMGHAQKPEQLLEQQQQQRRWQGKKQEQQHLQQQGKAGQQGTHTSGKGKPGQKEQQQKKPSNADAKLGGSLRTFVEANSYVSLWAELLKPELTVHALNGKLRVNDEIRNILGGQLVAKAAFGDHYLTQQYEQQHKLRQQQQQQLKKQHPEQHSQQQQQQQQAKTQLEQPMWQVHFTQQPRLDHAPPELPSTPAQRDACSKPGRAVKKSDNGSQVGATGSSSSSSQGAKSTQDSSSQGSKRPQYNSNCNSSSGDMHHWWKCVSVDSDAAVRLKEAMRVCGKGQCTPGEWQILSPNLQMQTRVWEVNGFKTLPLKSRKILGGHSEQQQHQQQEQAQQQQREQLRMEGKEVAHADANVSPTVAGLPSRFTLLHEPASMSLRFSHALARTALPVVAPILGQATSLLEESGDTITATFTPDSMTLPYKSASIHLGPLRVRLAASPSLNKLISALRGLPQGLSLSGKGLGSIGQSETGMGLEAWMSGMHIRMERSGIIEQRRLDVLLGPLGSLPDPSAFEKAAASSTHSSPEAAPGAAPELSPPGLHLSPSSQRDRVVHLVLWGAMDPATDQVSMTLGVAGSTLQHLLGLKNLPPGYCLPLSVRGNAKAPILELADLSKRLARLAVLRMAQHPVPSAESMEGQRDEGQGVTEGASQEQRKEVQEELRAWADQQSRGMDAGNCGEPEEKRGKGVGGKIKAVGSWVLRAAVQLTYPGRAGIEEIERQVAAEAACIPAQECDVPWLRGPDEKATS